MKKDWSWIKEIPGYENHFNETMKLAHDMMGFDLFFEFMETFGKQTIYFSEAPITKLMEEYAKLKKDIPYYQLARKFHVQEKTIYNWRNGNNKKDKNQQDLFKPSLPAVEGGDEVNRFKKPSGDEVNRFKKPSGDEVKHLKKPSGDEVKHLKKPSGDEA